MSKLNKNKLYRVKEKTDRKGRICYKVQAAESKWDAFFGVWIDYEKDNNTLDEAIAQIEAIDGFKLKKEKIVHKELRN
ncbi:MAG: hypothetical protein GY679_04120 [Mycoplasma sp.]|nr:hypothetical protein [Mycoplasma sp.]